MKRREGFVSNSSSASFIVKFTSAYPEETVQKHLNELYVTHKYRKDREYKGIETHSGQYWISAQTTMFNDWFDVVEWPFIKMLSEVDSDFSGYSLIEIRQIEDECGICDSTVSFDGRTWEQKISERYDEKKRQEVMEDILSLEDDYLDYLSRLNLPVDIKLLRLNHHFAK